MFALTTNLYSHTVLKKSVKADANIHFFVYLPTKSINYSSWTHLVLDSTSVALRNFNQIFSHANINTTTHDTCGVAKLCTTASNIEDSGRIHAKFTCKHSKVMVVVDSSRFQLQK